MRDCRSKHPREEEEEERDLARHGGPSRNGVTFERADHEVLVSLATITLWKVR